ncbi:MAG TPA: hypothetical protein VGV64_06550 [Thermoplasmata archaeon]|nr:hypothetical protein [Thermoplasmata archaeon]
MHDRQLSLVEARDAALAEAARLEREERYLVEQVRKAEEQVRYYESLLAKLRRDWGGSRGLPEFVRRLG